MMDWTDRHCRYFLRGFSARALLYTEMITAAAILRGDRARLLDFDPEEHPVALQLGGSDPRQLASAARIGEDWGYDEINLNCGCPSDRVHDGSFGACLMLRPGVVADSVAAMRASVRIPVTVKARIGVVVGKGAAARAAAACFDDSDARALDDFVARIAAAGAVALIIHARKAVLGGLSPKDNREVPPLRPEVALDLKRRFPRLPLVLNGGLRTAAQAHAVLEGLDGVMLGREAYHRPYVLAQLDRLIYAPLSGAPPSSELSLPDRRAVSERMMGYAARQLRGGTRLSVIVRHMLGLYAGEPGAREFRRILSEGARQPAADAALLRQAVESADRAARAAGAGAWASPTAAAP